MLSKIKIIQKTHGTLTNLKKKATWKEQDGMIEVNIFLSKIFIAFLLLFFLLMSLN